MEDWSAQPNTGNVIQEETFWIYQAEAECFNWIVNH